MNPPDFTIILTAAGIAVLVIAVLAGIGRLAMRAKGATYRRHPQPLPETGTFTHYTHDSNAAAIDNRDGTVTLHPHRTLGTVYRSIYLYGPNATRRGARYNHGPRKATQPVWTEIRVPAQELAAATARQAVRARWRPWDDAYAIVGRHPVTVPATVTTGVCLVAAKRAQETQ